MAADEPVAPQGVRFGALLKRYRVAAGLSQEALAEQARLSARTISALELGLRQAPYRDTVALLVQVLGLPARDAATLEAAVSRRRGPLGIATQPVPQELILQARLANHYLPAARSTVPPLVGRSRELALLERHLAGEGPPLLLLAGEPGIGKSRLLGELIPRSSGHGLRVLQGCCQRRSAQIPYAPLLEALQSHIQRRLEQELRAELRGCAWLARLLPELASGPIEPLPERALPPEQERRLMFDAVGRFVVNVAGPAGTLLLLDDLHWAGADALALLITLARSPLAASLRMVGTYRDTDVRSGDDLSLALADLAQAGLATQRTLTPLAPEEVGWLLDVLLDGAEGDSTALREQVVRRTGGVPFFVVSCAQVLRLHDAAEGGVARVPWDVAQGIRQRVTALTEAAREILGVAAVLGRMVQPDLLIAVAEHPERTVLSSLDEACHARLLIEDGSTYQFTHDLIREVVEADVGAARRLMLHRRVAQALEAEPGEPRVELLAYHYSRSGEHHKALLYLDQAGDRAEARAAHATAAGYYQEVVDRMEGIGRARDAAGVREKLGAVLLTAARYDAVVAALEPAAGTYRLAGDLESEGRVTARIGIAYGRRGGSQEGLRRIQPLLGCLAAAGPSHALAALYLARAELAYGGDPAEGLAAAECASEIAATLGDDTVLARAEVLRGGLLDHLGRAEEALGVLERAIFLAEAAGHAYALYEVLNDMAHIYDHLGEFTQSLQYIERALGMAKRAGDREWAAFLIMHRGFTAFFSGDWARARRDGEESLALYGQIGSAQRAAHPLMVLGFVGYGEGNWEEAASNLDRCVALAESHQNSEAVVMAQSVLAELELRQERPGAARARLLPLLEMAHLAIKETTYLVPKLAWAHLGLGEVDAAVRVAAQAVSDARARSDRLNLVEALRVRALVELRRRRWAETARSLDEALAMARGMGYPWGEARLLHVYGQMHIQKGEPAGARERLEGALAIFRRLGAREDSERVARILVDLAVS